MHTFWETMLVYDNMNVLPIDLKQDVNVNAHTWIHDY